MPCYSPLQAYYSKFLNVSGKRSLVFSKKDAVAGGLYPVQVPCGRCIGCRLEYSRQWAIRCVHESQMHTENCFITLTYDNYHLPPGGTLVLEHFQKFMKRFRSRITDPTSDHFVSSDAKIR